MGYFKKVRAYRGFHGKRDVFDIEDQNHNVWIREIPDPEKADELVKVLEAVRDEALGTKRPGRGPAFLTRL